MVELPAVLGFQAQAECVLELQRRRGDTASGEAHQKLEAMTAHSPITAARLRYVAPVQEELVVQVRRHAKLPVGRGRGGEAPREPPAPQRGRT